MTEVELTGELLTSALRSLLFRGGRAPIEVVVDDAIIPGLPREALMRVLAVAQESGLWVELGEDLVLCRRGWEVLGRSTP